jgi:hypothetical protein
VSRMRNWQHILTEPLCTAISVSVHSTSNVNVLVDVADVCGIQSILLSGMKRSRRTVPAPGMLTKLSLSTEEPEMLPPPIFSVTIFKMSTAVWF